ncbi:WYL domain-containing protein [bacterium]|nr:WYL domain-containing protein [bacterium]
MGKDELRYEQITKFFDLAIEMQSKPAGMTIEEIQNYMNVSLRTARRVVAALRGLETHCIDVLGNDGRKYRYGFVRPYMNSFITFSNEEIANLELLLKNEKNNEQIKNELKKTIKSIKAINNKKPQYDVVKDNLELILQTEGYAVRQIPKCTINPENVVKLRDAIMNNRKISCFYENKKGEKKKRILFPLGFLYGVQKTYLIARMDKKGDDEITFLVHKLTDIEILNETFDKKGFDLNAYAQKSFGIYHDEIINVKLLFNKEVADAVLQYEFHPTQQMKQKKDGSVEVTFSASGKNEMLWHIFTWGTNCKIIRPKSLINEYKTMLKDTLNNY